MPKMVLGHNNFLVICRDPELEIQTIRAFFGSEKINLFPGFIKFVVLLFKMFKILKIASNYGPCE